MPVQVPPGGQHVPRLLAGTVFHLGGIQGVLAGYRWSFIPGVPSLQATDPPLLSDQQRQETRAKCTINIMRWNHSETILPAPQSIGELSCMKPVPAAKRLGPTATGAVLTTPGTHNALSWWMEGRMRGLISSPKKGI